MRRPAILVVAATLVLATAPVAAQENGPADFEVIDVPAASGWKAPGGGEMGTSERWVVEFSARADLSDAAEIANRTARLAAVRAKLVGTAATSQQEARARLDAAGVPYDSFWLRNQIIFSGPDSLADAFAELEGVETVRRERLYPRLRPVAVKSADAVPEWGVSRIRADLAWSEGILGDGVVVGGIDGGVEFTHSALVNNYRGNLGGGEFDHNYNWWDPTGLCGPTPCPDPDGHGTHTMGTAVGGDGPGPFEPDIGVAPEARWIAAKGCEDFSCSEGALLSSGEFMVAPTDVDGANPDPSLAPHVVNNSWTGPPGDPFYQDIVDAWMSAGIIPVFSSGNPGPFCGGGGSPADYLNALSVGATDIDDLIAEFSGRGPSAFGKVNPDVVAPGVEVLSSVPGDSFEVFSGTSMAAPHTTGALALMMSAAPALQNNPRAAMDLLKATAVNIADDSCGGHPSGDPNNVYGDGRIDALAAALIARDGGLLAGAIKDAATGTGIGGAKLQADSEAISLSTTTRNSGRFRLLAPAGEYTVTASAFAYISKSRDVTIEKDITSFLTIRLDAAPRYEVSGVVTRRNRPAPGVEVTALGTPLDPVVTDADGRYSFRLPAGSYELSAGVGGCETSDNVIVDVAGATTADLVIMEKLDNFGNGCREIDFEWIDATTQSALFGDDVVGRLLLPFDVEFYGVSYDSIYVDSNGYVAFERPEFSDFFARPIPDNSPPHAAAYGYWHDLVIDEEASLEYDFISANGVDGVVFEYTNVLSLFTGGRGNIELKVWETGVIDALYGPGMDDIGAGNFSTIGIENQTSTDALMFSFDEPRIASGDALRFELMTTAQITGTVVNANNGRPVAGALVTLAPSGRFTRSGDDGSFAINVLAGSYDVTGSALRYGEASADVVIEDGDVAQVELRLPAARSRIRPKKINASAPAGERTGANLWVRNTGTWPLEWSATDSEVEQGRLSRAVASDTADYTGEWAASTQRRPAGLAALPAPRLARVIVEDPAGDAPRPPDAILIDADFLGEEAIFTIELTSGVNEFGGFMLFDTDQDPTTGVPGEELFALPEQELGVEVFVDLFAVIEGFVFIVDALTGELIAEAPAEVDGPNVRFAMPSAALEGPTGAANMGLIIGDFSGPTDWVPDVGNAQVRPGGADAKWIRVNPSEGIVEPGERQRVRVILRGQLLDPGEYRGVVTFRTNDPFKTIVERPVRFVVTPPLAIDPPRPQ